MKRSKVKTTETTPIQNLLLVKEMFQLTNCIAGYDPGNSLKKAIKDVESDIIENESIYKAKQSNLRSALNMLKSKIKEIK